MSSVRGFGWPEVWADLRSLFPELIPASPYCCDSPGEPLLVRGRWKAIGFRHLQFNGPMSWRFMTFDVDRNTAAEAAEDAGVRPPNFVSINPKNGHGHLTYVLRTSVSRFPASNLRPINFYAAVERGYRRRLKADRGYSGLIAKNPLHPEWRTLWLAMTPYDLGALDAELNYDDKAPEHQIELEIGAGRNVTLFTRLRHEAYHDVRQFWGADGQFDRDAFHAHICDLARSLNCFSVPLGQNEVLHTANSVAKWVARRFNRDTFSDIQSARGKRGAASRWLGHVAASATRPWERLGISRAKYYLQKHSK
ncbi:MAG: replication initiation protein [Hyphomicrobiaceae bacterium]